MATDGQGKTTWVVIGMTRLASGHLEVTYSVASGRHYVAEVIPGTDAASAVKRTGDILYNTYQNRGYV